MRDMRNGNKNDEKREVKV